MSGATAHRSPNNIGAFLAALGGEMGSLNELGKAEDDRLAQPARVLWVPVPRSGRLRECTVLYEDGRVFWERSFAYDVKLRGLDESAALVLEESLLNALVTLGATSPAVEIEDGDLDPFSVAAEQGFLIAWRIRVWGPIYYERFRQGHIETTATTIETTDQLGNPAGSIAP